MIHNEIKHTNVIIITEFQCQKYMRYLKLPSLLVSLICQWCYSTKMWSALPCQCDLVNMEHVKTSVFHQPTKYLKWWQKMNKLQGVLCVLLKRTSIQNDYVHLKEEIWPSTISTQCSITSKRLTRMADCNQI